MPKLAERQFSVERFATLCGLTRAAVYFYLRDKTRPEPESMAAMCQVLDVSLEEGFAQYTPKRKGRPGRRNR
ncbi:MAG: helix-turn-helix domain-containing protein [Bryobacteraceae bacterium]